MNTCRPEARERIRNARDDLEADLDVLATDIVPPHAGRRERYTLEVTCTDDCTTIPNTVLSAVAEHGLALDPDDAGRQQSHPVFVAVA